MSKPLHKYSGYFRDKNIFKDNTCFSDIEKKIIKLKTTPGRTLRQTKGDAFEVFAEALLATSTRYDASNVYPDGKIPIKILKKLNMNILDKGKDGVYISRDGRLNSYQVKFSSNQSGLSWRKLSTFIGVSEKANKRLLIANTNKIDDEFLNKPRVLNTNLSNLNSLSKNEIKNIEKWVNQSKRNFKLPTPDPRYQTKALKNIKKELFKNDRATVTMACGSGKTLVGLWSFEYFKPKTTIVFVPSIGLINQIRGDWLGNTKFSKLNTISICSSNDRNFKGDETKILQKDLDFEITTDVKKIKKFLSKKSGIPKILFCTYQSSHVLGKVLNNSSIDFAIFDEAHRTARLTKNQFSEKSAFSYALHDKNIKIKKRLFMTATRRVENYKKQNKEGDLKLSLSMDNKKLYGNNCYNLSFYKAAQKKVIAKSKIIISHVDSREVDRFKRSKSVTLVKGAEIKSEQIANQIAIRDAVKKYHINKTFVFHHTTERAKSFTLKGPEGIVSHLPKFYSTYVKGSMSAKLRSAKMQEFEETDKAIMSNARCLIEGIDVPKVGMVVFADPKQSVIDIVQATGRALRNRNQPNKKFGYILIPIFVERFRDEKISEALENTNYETVVQVLKALRNHDEEINQIISNILISNTRGKGHSLKAIKKLEERVEGIHESISKKELLKNIISKAVNNLSTKWDEMVGCLLAYKDKFGNCDVPKNYGENIELGKWVNSVRLRGRLKTLQVHQFNQMNDLGFNWGFPDETISNPKGYVYESNNKIISIKKLSGLRKSGLIKYEIYHGTGSSKYMYSPKNLEEAKQKYVGNFEESNKDAFSARQLYKEFGFKSKGKEIEKNINNLILKHKEQPIGIISVKRQLLPAYKKSIAKKILRKEKVFAELDESKNLGRIKSIDYVGCTLDNFNRFENKLKIMGYIWAKTKNKKEPVFSIIQLNKYKKIFDNIKKVKKKYTQQAEIDKYNVEQRKKFADKAIFISLGSSSFRKRHKIKRITLNYSFLRKEHFYEKKKINYLKKEFDKSIKISIAKKYMILRDVYLILDGSNLEIVNNAIKNKKLIPKGFIYYKNYIGKSPYFETDKCLKFLRKYLKTRVEREYPNSYYLKRILDYEAGKKLSQRRYKN